MPVDPSIILGIRPQQIAPPPDPMEQYGKSLALKKLISEQDDDNAVRSAYQQSGGDSARLRESLVNSGSYKQIQALDKAESEKAKHTAEVQKLQIGNAKEFNGLMGSAASAVLQNPTYENAVAVTEQLKSRLPPEIAAKMDSSQVPKDPVQLKQWAQRNYMQAIDAEKKMADQTSRDNNAATNATSRANNAATVGVQYARLNYDKAQPKGQIIQTDQGPMLVDPRDPNSAKPVTANGQTLGPKLKELPAPIQKAVMENNASLRKVNAALALVDSKPGAFGAMNYLGDAVRQRTDPGGVEARAYTADIGSLLVHDRSGAAVTAAETPRLQPFIPAATDSPATVKTKLKRFKQEYEAINNDIASTYTREAGYKPLAGATKSVAQGAPGAKPSLDDIFK
jgi:hypothetical protein